MFKDKDFSSKDKDKDCILKDKDCSLVPKESLRTRTNITAKRLMKKELKRKPLSSPVSVKAVGWKE